MLLKTTAVFALLSISSLAVAQTKPAATPTAPVRKEGPKAAATLESKNDSTVKGTIDFSETADGLQVKYSLTGLAKDQNHGFHIHEKGDCSSKDAKTAGPHYHKVAETGGTSLDFPGKYAGDLPQIKSDANGKAEGQFLVTGVTIDKVNPIDGRAIIVHAGPDDLTKKSAPRAACGLIKKTM